ncbi:hypothetical protein GCM10010532_037370 [Dactylosporangium siamense]|uniref:Uncharacterized protein n=1 Tax=Dactylosporangium siamense TaxID=685454 RepID=A0A919PJ88_9ACTN|nr:hypothetical protein Dsi01nite_029800 [Dactylosporangium siamense]
MLLVGWLVVSGPPRRAPQPQAGSAASAPSLTQAWPNATVVDLPGVLPDGAPYTPWLFLDASTSIGVAPTPDGAAQRVVARTADGVRELHRVAKDRYPNFLGFTGAGDTVFWGESVADPAETRIWRASVRGAAPTASLTADTGEIVFFNSQYDLLMHDGRLYWAAVGVSAEQPVTEIRSVPMSGGPTTVRPVDGAYQLLVWPWLHSAEGTGTGAGQGGPLEVRNLDTGRRITVPASPSEYIGCSPTWCRSIVTTGTDGSTRYDMIRSDGSDRRRVGGSAFSAAVADVALLDRFEPVLQMTGSAPDTRQRLVLYDLTNARLVTVAENVRQVLARQRVLWWSTGDQQHETWHSLDLGTLTG